MMSRRYDAWVATGVALAVRATFAAWAHRTFPPVEDGHYYDLLARRLASGAGYTWLWPDGAVTYAAHYPVGYPALLAAVYAVFGASTAAAMALNAVFGASAAYAAYTLVDQRGSARWRPLGAALAVAIHPALVPYTAAVMTEGVTASLVVLAAALASRAGRAVRPAGWVVAAGVAIGVATLVRPQSLVLAPAFGLFALAPGAAAWRRFMRAGAVVGIALLCALPWTARNCVRMRRCALVSVNGGWNLLIGATTTTGGWAPVTVPPSCATVWDEAQKDVCFERAAYREIQAAPAAWIAKAPAKVAMTLDYLGAAPWYLHSSNPGAFGDRAKVLLGAIETFACRLYLLGALVACGRAGGPCATARKLLALGGSCAALTLHAWMGYLAAAVCVALLGWRVIVRGPPALPCTAVVIAATLLTHALFFGAGRYGLIVIPFVTACAFVPAAAPQEPRQKPFARAGGSGEWVSVVL